jgi:hypothetical protein
MARFTQSRKTKSGQAIGDVVGPASANDNAVVRFDGTTGKVVQSSVFVIDDTGVASGLASLSIGGAAIGSNALGVTGTATFSGSVTASAIVVTGSAIPTNGMYLTSADVPAFAASGSRRWYINNGALVANSTSGALISGAASSATVPTVVPHQGSTTAGLGGTSGVPAMIVGSATIESWSSAGAVIASGKTFQLGNAAVTGLTAGVLAALTNASIVITDSTGQAYRIPCII